MFVGGTPKNKNYLSQSFETNFKVNIFHNLFI